MLATFPEQAAHVDWRVMKSLPGRSVAVPLANRLLKWCMSPTVVDIVAVASGRRVPRTGGVILARSGDTQALHAAIAADPFAGHGAARADIIDVHAQHDRVRRRSVEDALSDGAPAPGGA